MQVEDIDDYNKSLEQEKTIYYEEPFIYTVKNYITPEECEHMIKISKEAKAGVAASNIKWWGRNSYIKAQAKKIEDLYYIHNSVDKVDKEGNPKQSKITVFDNDKNKDGDQTGLRGDFARRNKDYDQFFLEKRREYDAAVKDLFNVVRSIVIEKLAIRSGAIC